MRALVIQQDPYSPTGPIGEGFADAGYDIHEFVVVPESSYPNPHVTVDFPDPLDFDVVVPLGAIWAVYDHHVIDWVASELELLRRAHDAGIPQLGICFGGQALAAALGGSVHLAPQQEVGWVTIDSARPDLIEPGPWFEWHQDRWVPPDDATVLATSPLAQQSFVLGRSLALQFHPEVTPETLELWLGNGGRESLAATGEDAEALMMRTREVAADAADRARKLVRRFLDQVATAPLPVAATDT